jgi:hypothetical protein
MQARIRTASLILGGELRWRRRKQRQGSSRACALQRRALGRVLRQRTAPADRGLVRAEVGEPCCRSTFSAGATLI